ncbi:gluzincin family metallopeptidase [Myroides sp. LJL116]
MRLNLFLIIILLSNFARAQQIQSYDGEILIDSSKTLNAVFKMFYVNSNKSEFYFNLNKNATIEKIEIAGKSIPFKTESDSDFLPDFKKIIIKNTFEDDFILEIKYSYPLDQIENPTFKYNPHWIELSLYTGWFPINLNDQNYSYKLSFKIPENYQVISPGNISKQKDRTLISNQDNYIDIPVILSDKFQVFTGKNKTIKFYGTGLSQEQINTIQHTSDNVYNFYESIFGQNDSQNLIVAINSFEHPMSYARKGFISLSLNSELTPSDKKTLAHEIGHLWWNNASFGTYEDWLNESFAEFSTIKWMQEKLSKNDFDDFLIEYELASQESFKVSQLTPSDPNWYSTVYLKYPYILYKLEQKIGKDNMVNFLKSTYTQRISTTQDLLKTLCIYADQNTLKQFKKEI